MATHNNSPICGRGVLHSFICSSGKAASSCALSIYNNPRYFHRYFLYIQPLSLNNLLWETKQFHKSVTFRVPFICSVNSLTFASYSKYLRNPKFMRSPHTRIFSNILCRIKCEYLFSSDLFSD